MPRQRPIVLLAALALLAALGVLRSSHPVEEGRFRRSLAASAPPPRVAHCLVGQGRTMDHPMIYQNYEAHVLSKIGAESDVFVVIDAPANGTDVYRPVAVEYMELPGYFWQYERWLRCLEMMSEHEKETGVQYSHVVVNRVDQIVLQDLPSIDAFPVKSMWAKPYGEHMDEYPSTYTHGDDGAVEPHAMQRRQLPDLFLILPRHVATELFKHIGEIYYNEARSCGKAPPLTKRDTEKALKCAAGRADVPIVSQHFQLRILRPHGRGGCAIFAKDFGKHYNSLCA